MGTRGAGHIALFEAGPAALADRTPLIREQRITAIISSLLNLAEERMSETSDVDLGAPIDDPLAPKPPVPPLPADSPGLPAARAADTAMPPQTPAIPPVPRITRLREALPEWAKAVELATKLEKVTPRTESLFRIVESEAFSTAKRALAPS